MKRVLLIMVSLLVGFVASANDSTQIASPSKDSIAAPKIISLTDSKKEKKNDKKQKEVSTFKPNPHTAMLLSAMVPGAGQVYNRKYWKLPIIYGGYAALIYAITWNNKEYKEYKKAYISIADDDATTNYFTKYIPIGQESTYDKTWLTNVLNTKQMNYRNDRDLSIIGIVAFYGLTVLDAFVDAELSDFDVSPNLSLHIDPIINLGNRSFANTTDSPSLGIQCNLTF